MVVWCVGGNNSNYSNTHIRVSVLIVIILISELVSSLDQCVWGGRNNNAQREDAEITRPPVALIRGANACANITSILQRNR